MCSPLTRLALIVVTVASVAVSAAHADENTSQQELRLRIEALGTSGRLSVAGVRITAVDLIADLYRQTRFEPVWTDPGKVDELLQAIAAMHLDGLDPQDYYLDRLTKMRAEVAARPDPALEADLDILLTDALARLAYQAYYGKVDPERIDHSINLDQTWTGPKGAAAVRDFLASESLFRRIEGLKPQRPKYDAFRRALARYRGYQDAGGWTRIRKGKVLTLGSSDRRVPAIRHRLAMTEDLPKPLDNGDPVYDADLQKAVHRFQARHQLPTGDLASKTIAAMNVPVSKRIDQIRVNLERARWMMRDVPPTYVAVNIAAFSIYFVKDDKRVWENEAQVGKTFTQTPLFVDEIDYIVLNPTWTVPPSVLEQTVLPSAKKDPGYMQRRHLRVFDDRGKQVPAKSIDWKRYKASNFPYTIRQDPGPDNALGVVKFIFPNRYHVYLHDTPNQLGYDRRVRTMSWGCIHVQNPLELATAVIDDPSWNRQAIESQVESGKTKTIHLDTPVRVALLYWTVELRDDGALLFYPDVYQRDGRVLRELNRAFKARKTRRRGNR